MPIFIQALPLSIKTFWRYLILLPFLAIAAFLLSLVQLVPIIGLIVPGTISAGLVIVGLRCGLAARGHFNPLDHGKLLRVSMIFCVINAIADIFLRGIHFAMGWVIVQANVEIDPIGLLQGLLGVSYYWAGVLLALLSPTALVTAALAVPMTSAAVSATHRGPETPIFFGLGSGILSLMVVMTVWLFGGHFFAIFGEVWATFGLIATALWSWSQSESIPWELSLNPWSAFGSTMFMTWASSWFFATAVLAWERKIGQEKADETALREANQLSGEDLRTMRQKRMKGRS